MRLALLVRHVRKSGQTRKDRIEMIESFAGNHHGKSSQTGKLCASRCRRIFTRIYSTVLFLFASDITMRIRSLLVLLTLIPAVVTAQDSPQWRGPKRDGHSPDSKLNLDWNKKPPRHLWTSEGGLGSGYGSVSIVGDRLYTTGNFDDGQHLVAARVDNGAVLWKRKLTDRKPNHGFEGSRCTPTVDNGHVYVVGSDGSIACLAASTGALKWQRRFSDWDGKMMSVWGFSESPLVDGKLVLCTPGGPNAVVVALDKMTGKEVWKCKSPPSGGKGKDGAGYASITISNAGGVRQYVTLVGRGVIGIRAKDGELLWHYDGVANRTANIPDPICEGNFVFCSSGYGTGSALIELRKRGRKFTVDEKYFLGGKDMQNHHGGMIKIGNHVYCGHGNNKGFPTCVDLNSGKVLWQDRGPAGGSAALTAVGKNLIYRYQNGVVALIAANPDRYELKGKFKPDFQKGASWAHPVVCRGKLYLREQDKLMCYEL